MTTRTGVFDACVEDYGACPHILSLTRSEKLSPRTNSICLLFVSILYTKRKWHQTFGNNSRIYKLFWGMYIFLCLVRHQPLGSWDWESLFTLQFPTCVPHKGVYICILWVPFPTLYIMPEQTIAPEHAIITYSFKFIEKSPLPKKS